MKLAVLGVVLVSQFEVAEAGETAIAGSGCVLISALVGGGLLTITRGTDAVGEVIESTAGAADKILNITAEAASSVIEEVGKESKTFVPVFLGVLAVLVLLAFNSGRRIQSRRC